MKNLAPQITRQRLLIEVYFTINVNENVVKEYLLKLTEELGLRTYGEPTIHSPKGEGKDINQGYDAFISLIDSGIALYIWTNEKFLSCVIYSCKHFSVKKALNFTKRYFKTTSKLVSLEF